MGHHPARQEHPAHHQPLRARAETLDLAPPRHHPPARTISNPGLPLFLKHQEPSTKPRGYNLRTSSLNRSATSSPTTRYATPPHPRENLRTCTRNRGTVVSDCGARTRPRVQGGRPISHPNPRALSVPRFLIGSFVIESSFGPRHSGVSAATKHPICNCARSRGTSRPTRTIITRYGTINDHYLT